MTAETIQILKTLYANENRQVFLLDAAQNLIWHNAHPGIFKTEEDCKTLLTTLHTKENGMYPFWHDSILYTAQLQFCSELDSIVIFISNQPMLTTMIADPHLQSLCQQSLASKRQSIFGISSSVSRIYEEVEAASSPEELEQNTIFEALNTIKRCCCQLMLESTCYAELEKYNEPDRIFSQPMDFSQMLTTFTHTCQETLGRRIHFKTTFLPQRWVTLNENRLQFCLLAMLSHLLSPVSEEEQTVFLQMQQQDHFINLTMTTTPSEKKPFVFGTFPHQLQAEPPIQQTNLLLTIIKRFCEIYNASFCMQRDTDHISYQLQLPMHPKWNIPLKLSSTMPNFSSGQMNLYQILLCEASDYRFY